MAVGFVGIRGRGSYLSVCDPLPVLALSLYLSGSPSDLPLLGLTAPAVPRWGLVVTLELLQRNSQSKALSTGQQVYNTGTCLSATRPNKARPCCARRGHDPAGLLWGPSASRKQLTFRGLGRAQRADLGSPAVLGAVACRTDRARPGSRAACYGRVLLGVVQ